MLKYELSTALKSRRVAILFLFFILLTSFDLYANYRPSHLSDGAAPHLRARVVRHRQGGAGGLGAAGPGDGHGGAAVLPHGDATRLRTRLPIWLVK